jgi:hypothetical protein
MNDNTSFRYRSFFWPILLIGVGALWLLASSGLLPQGNWLTLLRYWPILLIGVGLDLLIGRRNPFFSAIIAVGVLAVAVALILYLPPTPATSLEDVITDRYSEPLDEATSAEIDLDLSLGSSTIRAGMDPEILFDAEITHVGTMEYRTSGTARKEISMRERGPNFNMGFLDILDNEEDLRWDIDLSTAIPIYLNITGGVGDANLDFSDIQVSGINLDAGVGDVVLQLPATNSKYEARVESGVGDVQIQIEADADIEMTLDGGVGNVTIILPLDAAVHLDAETGIGSIHVPSRLVRVSAGDEGFIGEEGEWETSNYTSAAHKITITFDGGVGDLNIQ